jgi:hypothetical protein
MLHTVTLLAMQFNKLQSNCKKCRTIRFSVQRGLTEARTYTWPSTTLCQAWLRTQCFLYFTLSQLLRSVDVLYWFWVLVHCGVEKVDTSEDLQRGRLISAAMLLQSSGVWCRLVWRTGDGSCTWELWIIFACTNTHINPHRLVPTAHVRTQQYIITNYE